MNGGQATDVKTSGMSVRSILILSAFGIIAMAAISAFSLAHFAPDIRQLECRTGNLADASRPMQHLDSTLGAGLQDLRQLMEKSLFDGIGADTAELHDLLRRTASLADSSWSSRSSASFGQVAPEVQYPLALAYNAEASAVVRLVDAISAFDLGRISNAVASLSEVEELRTKALAYLREAERANIADLVAHEASLADSVSWMLRSSHLWLLACITFHCVLAAVVFRRVWLPIHRINDALDRVANGNLEAALPASRSDEFGRIERRFNDMISFLRKRSEAQHKHTVNLSERLRRTMEASSNEIYIFEVETWRFTYANRAAQENLGYTEEQLAAQTPLDLIPELNEASFERMLAPLKDGLQFRSMLSTTHRRADGTEYPVELSIHLSPAEDPPVFHAIASDTTESTLIEQERDRMFELSPDLLATGTYQGKLTRVNAAWGRQLGFTEDELLSSPFCSFVHPDDEAMTVNQIKGLRDGFPISGSAIRMCCRDGSFRWISWNVTLNEEDETLYAVGRDISDVRTAQQRQTKLLATITRSAREWKTTFDALDSPVLVVDRNGNVTRANEAARRMAGLSHPELLRLSIAGLPPHELWSRAATLAERAFVENRSVSLRIPSGSDRRVWNITVNPATGDHPKQQAAIVIAHDITRVVELQESAHRNEAMAATGALVAGVAHEVRNPLFSMTATLDAFEARNGPDRSGGQHIDVLRSQMTRLQELMQELLEYGKPPQLNLAATVFEHVAEQAVRETSHLAVEKKITVHTDIEADLPLIRADRARLVQVYVNLLANASQHSPEGSSISLSARGIEKDGAEWIESSVRDSGAGFSPDDLNRVFEPFYTRRRGGTGLGLALVQRIAEQHAGVVSASNSECGGGVVSVLLPLPSNTRQSGPFETRHVREAVGYAS